MIYFLVFFGLSCLGVALYAMFGHYLDTSLPSELEDPCFSPPSQDNLK